MELPYCLVCWRGKQGLTRDVELKNYNICAAGQILLLSIVGEYSTDHNLVTNRSGDLIMIRGATSAGKISRRLYLRGLCSEPMVVAMFNLRRSLVRYDRLFLARDDGSHPVEYGLMGYLEVL